MVKMQENLMGLRMAPIAWLRPTHELERYSQHHFVLCGRQASITAICSEAQLSTGFGA
jgi:hypothetical protein